MRWLALRCVRDPASLRRGTLAGHRACYVCIYHSFILSAPRLVSRRHEHVVRLAGTVTNVTRPRVAGTSRRPDDRATDTAAQPKPSQSSRPIKGFALRGAQPHGRSGDALPRSPSLQQLQDMFGSSVEPRVIQQLHAELRPDTSACVEALLAMSGPCDVPADALASPDSVPEAQDPHAQDSTPPAPAGNGLWDSLPPDCQLLIADMLPAKTLAVAATTCRSFAALAARRFGALNTIRCRRGCSINSLPGLLASHHRATQVRCRMRGVPMHAAGPAHAPTGVPMHAAGPERARARPAARGAL
jgi:hypothetical protein